MAYKFEKPVTRVGVLVNLCWNASLRLCAGSVEMMSTEGLTRASRMDIIELHVVLPTPPFPPTKTHFSVSCSRIFCTVPSGNSSLEPINQCWLIVWLKQLRRRRMQKGFFLGCFLSSFRVSVFSGEFIRTVGASYFVSQVRDLEAFFFWGEFL